MLHYKRLTNLGDGVFRCFLDENFSMHELFIDQAGNTWPGLESCE
jgi:hypothetical protein